jgi:hypothetical protein
MHHYPEINQETGTKMSLLYEGFRALLIILQRPVTRNGRGPVSLLCSRMPDGE